MGQLVRAVAAGRKAKVLFKTLRKVEVQFNPFDPSAVTAREFLRRVRTPPVRNENPQLEVSTILNDNYGHPLIRLTYDDNEVQEIHPADSTIADIVDEVERVARWKGENSQNPFDKLRAAVAASKN